MLAEGGCVDELAQAIRRVAKGVTEHDDDDITFGDALPHFSNEFITRSHTTIHVEPIRHFSCEENALAERLCYSLGTSIVAPIIGKKDVLPCFRVIIDGLVPIPEVTLSLVVGKEIQQAREIGGKLAINGGRCTNSTDPTRRRKQRTWCV